MGARRGNILRNYTFYIHELINIHLGNVPICGASRRHYLAGDPAKKHGAFSGNRECVIYTSDSCYLAARLSDTNVEHNMALVLGADIDIQKIRLVIVPGLIEVKFVLESDDEQCEIFCCETRLLF
jgi:hypothetical protein